MAEVLQAAQFPLWGSRLIEASAGTGKTWTIAALYLRLVLGHGGDAAFVRPLAPAEVLVMTFTRAATRELSDRIRSRLLEAARCFRGESSPRPEDTFLAELLTAYAEGPPRRQAAWRLTLAAESMDDAAVHTIDAWCRRMLREHAFDSGCLFDEELAANERAMQLEAAHDYWRQQLYPLPAPALDEALAVWPGVEALAADTQALLEVELPAASGQGTLRDCIERACHQRAAALARLKLGWAGRAREMRAWLDNAYDGQDFPFDRRKLAKNHYGGWLAALATWAEDAAAERPELTTTAVARLKPAGMRAALKPGAEVDLPRHFEAFAQLMQELDAVPALARALRLHAAAQVQQRLAELKQQAGSFGFADMLGRLDQALDPAHNGAAAERLRARILAQTPVALVDEFQDTSPLQASIFDRLYRVSDNERETALLLIGDPKQSIYGFRGADIHSYLSVRRATTGRHYVLGTNHRATVALVAAVNHVFEQAEERPGEGAFLYRTEAGGSTDNDPLPFVPVQARGRGEVFVTSAGAADPVTLVLDAELQSPREHLRTNGRRCAERIVALLNDRGAGFQGPNSAWARLRPADVAVLVRTGREAAAVRQALRRRGVASVYLSDKDSVLRSAEAQDLLRLLRAVAAPLDARLVRAALATRLLGFSLAELARLADDDEAFDLRTEQFRQLHAVWQAQGVLAMLRQALHRLDLPARWLAMADAQRDEASSPGGSESESESERGGERRLTNVLHLAELLQAASARLRGEQALIRWLVEQMQGEGTSGDEQIVRLESDADLVQVITVHKAKGLEYPLVFLPFACTFRAVDRSRTRFLNLAGADGARTLHLQVNDELLAAADKDRLREDLRLLYVALTRARHALWLGVAALTAGRSRDCSAHRSAFGCLVGGGAPTEASAFAAQVQALALAGSGIVVETAQAPGHTPLQPRAALPPLRWPAAYAASFERHWSIGSFTALVRALPGPVSAVAARDDEVLAPADAAEFGVPVEGATPPGLVRRDNTAGVAPWHAFPRGAAPGNFLHGLLEWLAGEGFDQLHLPLVREQLQHRCVQQGQGRHAAAVQTWLTALVATELPPLGTTLSGLERLLPEMEFWFPGDGLDAGQVDALCRAHLLDGVARPPLPGRELRGMLMGFADLVFEYGGRWWVLDYKSNALGTGDADYTPQALRAAMAEHRYDVQAALYLLALHRLLRQRLGAGYDPARQLGGALYFFIRGIRGPARGCLHVPPSLPLLAALEALLQRGAAVAT